MTNPMNPGDAPGWHPDAAGRHELRYWDGGAWTDNVSDRGVASTDLVGGKPLPPPSQAAAPPGTRPSGAGGGSKTPVFVAVGAVAVVVIAAVAFFALKDDGGGSGGLGLGTFKNEKAVDADHPTIHRVELKAGHGIFVTLDPKDSDVTVSILVLTSKDALAKLKNRIDAASDIFTKSFDDVFSDLRAEDIGAKGEVGYLEQDSSNGGDTLRAVAPIIVSGEYEFIPVVFDSDGNRVDGKYNLTLEDRPLDLGSSSELSDLDSSFSDNGDVSDFLSSS